MTHHRSFCPGLAKLGSGVTMDRNLFQSKEMMAKYNIGTDHLLDYLEKQVALSTELFLICCSLVDFLQPVTNFHRFQTFLENKSRRNNQFSQQQNYFQTKGCNCCRRWKHSPLGVLNFFLIWKQLRIEWRCNGNRGIKSFKHKSEDKLDLHNDRRASWTHPQ